MTRVRAAVCRAFGEPLVIEEVTLADPGPGEVEVRLAACAVCHSDISMMDGGWGGHLPAVYGHEAAGHVVRTGPGVPSLAPGDTVLVTLFKSCGACPSCLSARPATCLGATDRHDHPISGTEGLPYAQGIRCGAFAERVVVDQTQIVPIPPDIPLDSAALLSCGVITGIGAVVNTAGLRAGQTAVVIGAGGVGLNVIQGARLAGATHIVAVDMVPEKLEIAREFGATAAVLGSEEKPWRAVRQIIGTGADHVFVATGAIQAFETAPRFLGFHGRMTLVGMPHNGQTAGYEPVIFSATGQQILGSKMGDGVPRRDIPWMAELYRQGRLKLDELISGRWPLDRINEAIADTRTGGARRNVILFDPEPAA
ncbi:Zn-dependent alcohol dehydrogenase [Psychromarinibacter sp. C21-152]|uniref:Zn-dependent alcohol dehydrogenase n=1 Tax=Psychromarinibacter sediminicola TaxID=3033385 RepID=A0AAE3T6E7_9RHOB|nr:Zn-dependent alcohol dehydrogenase [Psychromarinibacter sediminicola]MDF0599167.1 Zn-dependent alcohol dehydrogenase [Psychromarinibacter sediminicola]